jgi:transposase
MGVDEIYGGKNDRFLTVVSNLETGEPLWFGKERKKEMLDEFLRTQLRSGQRRRIEACCVDMWEAFRLSIEEWVPGCCIVYDKFHIIQHANDAVEEVRRAEFFRKGPKMRDLIKGKRWLLLSRWKNLAPKQRGVLNRLFQLNRRVFKAYLLKESLEQLWNYRYEGAMVNYLRKWMDQLWWQRLPSVPEARRYVTQAPRRDSQLLPDQSTLRSRRGDQRQHPHAHQSRTRLQKYPLPSIESQTHGRHQH